MYTRFQLRQIEKLVRNHLHEYKAVWTKKEIKKYLEEHNKYKTLVAVFDKAGNAMAMLRFNIENDTALILDAIVTPEYRGKNLLRVMATIGHYRFPFVTTIKFQDSETPDTDYKMLPITERLLKCQKQAN